MNNYLEHHGIMGQKWGVRRYQNPDGSVTSAGAKRYYGGGSMTKSGKYKASNGVVIAKSNSKAVDLMRRGSNTLVGRGLSAAGRGAMSRLTGRSKESLKEQEQREREALKEYYKNGGDKMFKANYKSKYDKKADKLDKKINKVNALYDKEDAWRNEARAKNRSKIEAKYDKKLAKINADEKYFESMKDGLKDKKGRDIATKEEISEVRNDLLSNKSKIENKKAAKLKDFDIGTDAFNKASSIGRENSTKYLEMKKDQIYTPEIKNTSEYKQAKSWYNSQMISDLTYSKTGTMINEAHAYLNGKSATRTNKR